jgi:uncharacterized membrane protein
MHAIEESININAPASKVWSILTNLSNWSDWNSFIVDVKLEGATELAVGAKIIITTKIKENGKPENYTNEIVKDVPDREIAWRGTILSSTFLEAEHYFRVEPSDDDNSCSCRAKSLLGFCPWLCGSPCSRG